MPPAAEYVFVTYALADPDARSDQWWWADEPERTHMDLRRWLEARWREGYVQLALRSGPRGDDAGEFALEASDGERVTGRVVRAAEAAWLVHAWPLHLHTGFPWATGRLAED